MTIVLKYGGNAMAAVGAPDPLLDEIAAHARAGDRVVIVHGGGPQIDAELVAHGIVTERIGGLRITDAATLAVTERVLCGEVNKALVRALARRGARPVGISGQDGALLRARCVPDVAATSLGFVGDVTHVDAEVLEALLDRRFVPVVAPLGIDESSASALNVNADTAAGAIAGALRADVYVIVTDVARVRRELADPQSGIARMTESEAEKLLANDVFGGGMRPKIESALRALAQGAGRVVIGAVGLRTIDDAIAGKGTTLVRDRERVSNS